MTQDTLPEPLTPPDCDLRDVEPPRELFVEMAMCTFGYSRHEAERLVDQALAAQRRH